MIFQIVHRFALAVAIHAYLTQTAVSDDLPTGRDIASAYQLNAATFESARIQWKCELHRFEPYRKVLLAGIANIERTAADTKLSEGQRANAKTLVESYRHGAKTFRPSLLQTMNIEQFRSGTAIQFRIREDGRVIPLSPLSAESLRGDFSDIAIISRAEKEAPWCGWSGIPGQPVISVSPGFPLTFILAPAFLTSGEVTENILHPMDRFFSDPDSLTVVGKSQINGYETLVVQRSEPLITATSFPELKGRVTSFRITEAWIDPANGFIPRRIQRNARWIVDGKEVAHAVRYDKPLQPELDEIEIARVDGAGFFPVRGKLKSWVATDEVSPGILEVVDGKAERPLAHIDLISEIRWEGSATAKAPETVYDLKTIVPPGVLVADVRTQTVLAQNDQGDLIRARAGQLGVSPTRSNRHVLLIAAMVLTAIAFVVAGLWIAQRATKQ